MIVLVGHQKGGVGKSTIAVNLATELQRRGSDVCILEADPTIRSVSNWARDRAEAGLQAVTVVRQTGNIRETLLDLDQRYGFVLVDTAGKDSQELRSAMTAAHCMVAPMQPSLLDLDSNKALVEVIEFAKDFNPGLKVKGLLNRVSNHVFDTEAAESRQYMLDVPGLPLTDIQLHDRKVYRKAMDEGRGVVEMRDPKAKAEIQLLLDEVLSW
jgi:chromosome partitioning protein